MPVKGSVENVLNIYTRRKKNENAMPKFANKKKMEKGEGE